MDAVQPSNPAFGQLICVRTNRIAPGLCSLLYGLLAIMFGSATRSTINTSGPTMQVSWDIVVWMLLASAAAAGAVHFGKRALSKVSFYELGAVREVLWSRVTIPYVEVASLLYSIVIKRHHGVAIGTRVTIKLSTEDKRRISFSGGHRSRHFLGFRHTARVDELDVVRKHVAAPVADRLAKRLFDGQLVRWGPLVMTSSGLVARRGRYAGREVPYADINKQGSVDGRLSLFRRGDEKAFVTISMNSRDFWPCLALFGRLIDANELDLMDLVATGAIPPR
jgi:hypothetical protein